MTWIFEKFSRDFLFLILPGFLAIIVSFMSWPYLQQNQWTVLYGIFVMSMVDSGHVFMTIWRTWLHPVERKTNSVYWLTPVLIFLTLIFWIRSGIPYLWSFVVYVTVFHNVRQFFGVQRWYQRLNHQTRVVANYLTYLLMGIPFLAFHFRSGIQDHYYISEEFFFHPSPELFQVCIFIYGAVLCFWFGYELKNFLQGKVEYNRILSMAVPATLYSFAFFYGKSLIQVAYPLSLAHGIAYLGMMGIGLRRTRAQLFRTFSKAIVVLTSTAIIFGLANSYLEKNYLDVSQNYLQQNYSYAQAVLIAVYLLPLLCHYYFDAFLWKGTHREAELVYGRSIL